VNILRFHRSTLASTIQTTFSKVSTDLIPAAPLWLRDNVEVSDALVVEDIICEASQSIRLDALPVSAANIGRVCIAKVKREPS
jgi:hypothetical protein